VAWSDASGPVPEMAGAAPFRERMGREGAVMVDLTENGRYLVAAILAAPIAWQSPAELAGATGFGQEETTDLLAVLDDEGWLSAWERPEGVVVTLSVAAASRLEVRLVETGPEQTPRWAWRAEPEPPEPRAQGVFRGGRVAMLELVVDSRPRPDQLADRAEEAAARASASTDPRVPIRAEILPRPTILVGTGLSPWPGPGDGRKVLCPACRSRRLGPSTYCLCCDRWGLDHLLGGEPAPLPAPNRDPREDARKRDQERRARKEKRRACRLAQAEADRRLRRGHRRAEPS
jgi:hypothetical protein